MGKKSPVKEVKKLTDEQGLALKCVDLQKQLANTNVLLLKERMMHSQTHQKLLHTQVQVASTQISLLNSEMKTMQEKVANIGKTQLELKKEIGEEIGCPSGKFGFDPDTLEISED